MLCLQLPIPPLPQFMTVGHSVWQPGECHFRRNFQVYDILMVAKGTLYMMEDGVQYAIGPDQVLVLESGRTHEGYRPCEEETDIYWIHFIHSGTGQTMMDREIPWTTVVESGTDQDTSPSEQYMYMPKFGSLALAPLLPLLHEMLHIHRHFSVDGALRLQSLLAQVLVRMQAETMAARQSLRSYEICKQVQHYLRHHMKAPFSSEEMKMAVPYHTDYLARCLKKHTGMSPLQYLHAERMQAARRLLAESDEPIQQIAEAVGIPDYNYFIRAFRSHVGVPPGAYRRQRQGFV
ncbi:AraC family transcriptional regulator [Paenibacillaceae bacterium]|nr:AraC family transcriptional regulator [Paenibacillaceae bacterium]